MKLHWYKILFLIGMVFLNACVAQTLTVTTKTQKATFYVEVADTPELRQQGLMQREYLQPEKGMLFVFDGEGIYSFWMKNTRIPLDMIFIDRSGVVTGVVKNAQPCMQDPCMLYTPTKFTKYVFEVNAGTAERYEITEGSHITIQ
ncbi:DUF192 domain-containing protein [Candidatus Woesearchaeota archaeon]|nr:DUF192 domain-containing protein [Candidatus Woesearchaeota archaeon]